MSRRCILVLGMHRSGTSALTGVLGLLGAAMPRETMAPAADNPRGYWESPRIARFNNRLLESAGTRWNDDAAIAPAWFEDSAREADRAEAVRLVTEEFPGAGPFACKDPRICRLLPFWRSVFEAADVEPRAVLLFRDPLEVARSLAARSLVAEFRPAAIAAADRGVALWLRYMLDAERHSRGLPRHALEYRALLDDWRSAVAPLVAAGLLSAPTAAVDAAVDAYLDPTLRRQRADGGAAADRPSTLAAVVARLRDAVREESGPSGAAASACDAVAKTFDRLVTGYAPLRGRLATLDEEDPWARAIVGSLERMAPAARPARARAALFLSGAPTSVGHVLRVEHAAAALAEAGWRVSAVAVDDPRAPALADGVDIVVAFRAPWSGSLAVVADRCRQRGVPFVYDVDDLIFEPELVADGSIAVMAAMSEPDRARFAAAAAEHRATLERSAAAVMSTAPLVAAAGRLGVRGVVLPNSLDPRLEAAAAEARGSVVRASATDGRPRLVFASGTPSHDRDFAVAAAAIGRLFARRPEPLLVMLGHIDPAPYPDLRGFADRIEVRPAVPLPRLFAELARCDVNLAPLEPNNRFCEAKSAIRCVLAAAVGLPTVASPTAPLREAVVAGETGLLAAGVADWERQLERLVDDAEGRDRMGAAARIHVLAQFGCAAYRERTLAIFDALVARDPRPSA